MAYPEAKVEIFVGGQWVDITADVYHRARIKITRGKQDRAARPSPARCRLHLKNTAVPKYSPVNPTGEYYGQLTIDTPIRVSVNPAGTQHFRFTGEIPAFPLERNKTDKDRWVAVDAFGPLYGLQRRSAPAHDALRRHIEANNPKAYWPLTDGQTAREGSEVAAGGQPIRAKGEAGSFYQGQPDWGRGSLARWLDSTVSLPANTEGNLSARVRQSPQATWTCDHFRAGVGGVEDDLTVFDNGAGSDSDPIIAWLVVADRTVDQVKLWVLSAGETVSTVTDVATINAPGIFDLSPHMLRVTTTANGSSTDWELVIDGVSVASGTHAVLHRPVSRIRYRWGAFASMAEPLALGHIALWEDAPDPAATYQALLGHDGELAGRRIERLCAEEGVGLRVIGDLDDTVVMGPQQPGELLDLLGAAVDVDGGVLTEALDELALEYRTLRSKYNQGG